MEDFPDAVYGNLVSLLSKCQMENLKRMDIVSMSATIGDLIDRIVAEGQENNIGLEYSHGETIVQHGVKTNQLKESVTLIAFAGEYS